jgi:hypothetical protein
MLNLDRISEVAEDVARTTFGAKRVEDVRVSPESAWTGEDALRVMIVLHPTAARTLGKPGKASGVLNELSERLDHLGEQRFAYVSFATQAELDAGDDPEC